jgi:hypothetical protein
MQHPATNQHAMQEKVSAIEAIRRAAVASGGARWIAHELTLDDT